MLKRACQAGFRPEPLNGLPKGHFSFLPKTEANGDLVTSVVWRTRLGGEAEIPGTHL